MTTHSPFGTPSFQKFIHARHRLQLEVVLIDLCAGKHVQALALAQILDCYTHPERFQWKTDSWGPWVRLDWATWWRCIRLPQRTGRRALDALEKLGYVRSKVFQIGEGVTARTQLHVALNQQWFLEQWERTLRGQAPIFLENGDEG